MSNSKKKLYEFSNYSEDEEWSEVKKDVIVVDDDVDDESSLIRQHSARPRRSTAKNTRYNEVGCDDSYGMINEYSSIRKEPVREYTGKRGQYQQTDPIAALSNGSINKKKVSSSSEVCDNNPYISRINKVMHAWTKDCPIDFAVFTILRNDAIRSQRCTYEYTRFDIKIIISCVYFGVLKYDYIRDYYQNYVTICRAKECIKFCVNRDPNIYASFEDANNESIRSFEEIVDFSDIEEAAIGPSKGYSDQISGELLYFAALTLYNAIDPRYGGNYYSQLSVIACGSRKAFDSAYTEAAFDNSNENFNKGLQDWPSRYILLFFHDEKELESFNSSMSSVLPDRVKPVYKSYSKQLANYLASHHAWCKNHFDQSDLQRKNYEDATRAHSKRERKRRSNQITIDDNTHIHVVDPEDKVTYFSYPFNEDAKDVITIFKGDLKCLSSFNYLNDALIDFKIKLLINECPAEIRSMIHSFHCSFGKKLLEAITGREYQSVCNWTNKIDLFKFKYIIVPMNKGMHWSVAIIVNPFNIMPSTYATNEVIDSNHVMDTSEDASGHPNSEWHMNVYEDKIARSDLQTYSNTDSFIVFMDSLNMHNHLEIGDKLNNYLLEEWREKKRKGDLQPLRLVKCNVPRQQNGFDCGIFVIKYVTHFLQKCHEYEKFPADRKVSEIYHETFAVNAFNQEHATKERNDMLELCHTMSKHWSEWKIANSKESNVPEDDDYIEQIK